jgi:exopolysaccharide biosynthesis protein
MRKEALLTSSVLTISLISCFKFGPIGPRENLHAAKWETNKIAPGLTLKKHHFKNYEGHPQFVAFLEVDTKKVLVRLVKAKGLQQTSALAKKVHALAAINGGYFRKDGAAVGSLVIAGKDFGLRSPKMATALALTKATKGSKGTPIVLSILGGRASSSQARKQQWILAAGPRLLSQGAIQIDKGFAHALHRHPRTAAGITKKGKLLLLVVDGRNPKSHGLTCKELAVLMKKLHCISAINLDGGGSTTLYARGEGKTGVVNHPSDNHVFDARGERRVGNALVLESR